MNTRRDCEGEIVLWLPRGRDHELARSLGLIAEDRRDYTARVHAAAADLRQQGHCVRILRCSPSRVVAAMERLRVTNEPAGRAAAFAAIRAKDEHLEGDA